MADIDFLQIKISADANKASKSLDELASRMLKFAQSLSFDTGKLTSISSGIRSISDAATGFKGGKAKEIAALANSLSKFDSIDTNSVRGVGSALQEFSAGLYGAKEIDTSGILNAVSAVQKLGSKSATAGTKNLITAKNDLVEFVNGLNNIQAMTFDPTGITNAADAISKLGGTYVTQAVKNLPSLSAQMQNFVRQMNGIGELNFDMSGLTSMVSAISRLGSTASGRAVSNIPELGRVLKELFTTLSTAPHVSTNIIQMTEALAKLAKTGASSGRAVTSLSNSLNLFSNSASKAQKRSFSLASAIGKLYAGYFLLFRGFGKVKESIELSSALTEVQNVVDTTFGDMSYKVDDFAKSSIQQFGMSELAVKQYSSTFQAMGVAMGISNRAIGDANQFLNKQTDGYVGLSSSLSDVSLNLTKLTADIASFYNKSQDVVAEDLASIFTGMVVPMRKYGLDLTQASLKEFALKNGLDANVESMTQAEKTMLRYQYVLANTTAAQGDFAKTADTWANQVRILKQNFEQLGGTIGGSLINAFKPFLQTLNNVLLAVNSFAEKVTAALGSIFGWKYESGGKGVADSWTDSMDDFSDSESNAASNAKKLKNALMGIDELNIISQDNGTGGSGGTGGITGTEDVDGGKLVKTDTIFENYKSEIKNLEQLGAYIGDALSKAMESIDWQKTYEKARNFGTGLAQFLNGLISPRLFGNVGTTIAGALNTAVQAALSFGKTFDFVNFGKSIASGINNFFETFNFKDFAETVNVWAQGILNLLETTIAETDWQKVAKGLADFTLELDFNAVIKLSFLGFSWKNRKDILKAAKLELAKLLSGDITLNDISLKILKLSTLIGTPAFDVVAADIWDKISLALEKLMPEKGFDIVSKIGAGIILGAAAGSWFPGAGTIAGAVVGAISGALDSITIDNDSILQKIFNLDATTYSFKMAGDFFQKIKDDFAKKDWASIGIDILNGIGYGLWGIISFPVEPIADLFQFIWDEFSNKFGIQDGTSEAVKPIGEGIGQGVIDGFISKHEELDTSIQTWYEEHLKPWFATEKWSELANGMKEGIIKKWNDFKTWWNNTGFAKWWKDVSSYFTTEKWTWAGIKEGLVQAWNNAIESIKQIWNKFANWLNEKLTFSWDAVNIAGREIVPAGSINLGKIPTFEDGGYVPNTFSMFIAGENGIPELMGTVGGRTAVAGGEEITGIREAINSTAEVQIQMMQQEIELLKQLLAKDTGTYIGDREIARAAERGRKSMGYQIIS